MSQLVTAQKRFSSLSRGWLLVALSALLAHGACGGDVERDDERAESSTGGTRPVRTGSGQAGASNSQGGNGTVGSGGTGGGIGGGPAGGTSNVDDCEAQPDYCHETWFCDGGGGEGGAGGAGYEQGSAGAGLVGSPDESGFCSPTPERDPPCFFGEEVEADCSPMGPPYRRGNECCYRTEICHQC